MSQAGVGAFEVAALALEELAVSRHATQAFWREANPWNIDNPHDLLSFPHGSRPTHPALVLALLTHFEKLEQPEPEQRTVRARLASSAAAFESLLGEHDKARRFTGLALRDYAALAAHFTSLGKERAFQAEQAQLGGELVRGLEVAIELRAGDLSRAKTLAASLGANLPKNDESWTRRARASQALIKAFVALFQGETQLIEHFAASTECDELSGCFIVKQDLISLVSAARGNPGAERFGQSPIATVLFARRAKDTTELRAALDQEFTHLGLQDHPLDQLYRASEHAMLAEALGEPRHAERFRRAAAQLRPVALDPRLVFPLRAVSELR